MLQLHGEANSPKTRQLSIDKDKDRDKKDYKDKDNDKENYYTALSLVQMQTTIKPDNFVTSLGFLIRIKVSVQILVILKLK